MRFVSCLLAASFLIAALPAGGQTSAPPALRIVEILADPDATLGQREFIELWNPTGQAVGLAGWRVRDNPTASGSTNTFTFPAWSLAPGGRVVVWGGGVADGRGPAWSNPTVWNNAGDAATRLDPTGVAVDWAGYGASAPPPDFANRSVPAAAAKGQSVQLDNGVWAAALPTPGAAPGSVGGSLVVEIANVPPAVAFSGLPLPSTVML